MKRSVAGFLFCLGCQSPPGELLPSESVEDETQLTPIRRPYETAIPSPPSPIGTPRLDFHDATESSGILFTVELRGPELVAGGVGLFDADGDLDLDVLLTSDSSESKFFRNQGDATFVDATAEVGLSGLSAARGVAVADYDNDGDSDVYVCRDGFDRLFRNDAGVFSDVAPALGIVNEALSYSATWCDIDRDGDVDLYVGNYLVTLAGRDAPYFRGNANRLYRNDGTTFVDIAPALGVDSTGATLAVTCLDYDDDGDPDLFEVNDYGMFNLPNRLWRNDGERFVDVAPSVGLAAEIFGMGAAASDYDNDGDLDLYVSNFASNLLHQNTGGVFVDVARDVNAAMMGFRDSGQKFLGYPTFDTKDPWLNPLGLFVATYCDQTSTDHLFTHWNALFFDYDQDGWQDLYVANGYVAIAPTLPEGLRQPNRLLRNATGTFVDRSLGSRADVRGDDRVTAAGDLDGDGDLDLVVAGGGVFDEASRTAHVLLNDGLKGHWLTVRPIGTTSNRDSIGARVVLRAAGIEQLREISGGFGFASAEPHLAHFGLGEATVADEITIRWPSGIEKTLFDVPADQRIEVTENP